MISKLRKYILNALRVPKSDLNEIAQQVVRYYQDDIVEMNQEQLEAGQYATGGQITPAYAPYTVQKKREKGQVADRVTLHDTGAFYESIYVGAQKSGYYVYASDIKTTELEAKYADGNSILFGLNERNKDKFRQLALTLFASKYYERLRVRKFQTIGV
jgi:hypothetical protein